MRRKKKKLSSTTCCFRIWESREARRRRTSRDSPAPPTRRSRLWRPECKSWSLSRRCRPVPCLGANCTCRSSSTDSSRAVRFEEIFHVRDDHSFNHLLIWVEKMDKEVSLVRDLRLTRILKIFDTGARKSLIWPDLKYKFWIPQTQSRLYESSQSEHQL